MYRLFGLVVFFCCLFVVRPVSSQSVVIPLESNHKALVFQTSGDDHLFMTYFGDKLNNVLDYAAVLSQRKMNVDGATRNNLAYVPAGANTMGEPAIAIVHTDGNNSLDLLYQSHKCTTTSEGAVLTKITLKDAVYNFYVDLMYEVWKDQDVFEQWTVLRNEEGGKVMLNKFASANLYFYDDDYYLTSYNGGWARELQPELTHLVQGRHVIASVLGTRENLFSSQNFMFHFNGVATENKGTVMLGQLAWNGNYAIDFEIDNYKNLRLIAGINSGYQSAYELDAGDSFETPGLVYTLSDNGIGEASRNLQTWMRKHRLLNGEGERLTLLNNWEATYFNFDQQKLAGLFGGAKKLGVDLFLLDDGWFGNKYPRNSHNAGLGDWQANKKKLPDGIGYLVQQAAKEGVRFGIWIEPEMVNPKSELCKQHPDWVIREPQRPDIYFRNQLVLDLTNPEVQDFVFGVVDRLFTQNPSLAYIKWDCNAPIYNGHSMYLQKTGRPQSHLYIDYTNGLEKVLKRIRAKYPTIPMMLCSGGGGRTDYSLLKYFTEFWPSDNTDPVDRIFLQWNYSYYYPSIAVSNHVTNAGNKSIKYKVDVASMGKLGFDIVVDQLMPDELAFCQTAVKNYNEFKDVVWHGDMYRLQSPYDHDYASLIYVSETREKAVMFNYLVNWRHSQPNQRPVKLQGLNPDKKYTVKEINLSSGQRSTVTSQREYSGDFLMSVGFNPDVRVGRPSVVLEIAVVD